MENSQYEKSLEEYHGFCDEEETDFFILGAAAAIIHWILLEKELKHGILIHHWYFMHRIMLKGSALNSKSQSSEHSTFFAIEKTPFEEVDAKAEKIVVAAFSFTDIAFKESNNFRSFVNAIGVSGQGSRLKPEERGKLMTALQAFLAIVKEYEPNEHIEKYEKDINDICLHQLEGEEIIEEVKSAANNFYQEVKGTLLGAHPID